jgi:hypothetical protein
MNKLLLPQNSMSFGEISPNAQGRDDIAAYASGVRTLLNYNLLLEGGAERRWGSEWIAELEGEPRMFPFEFNEDQQYILVLTNLRLDIWQLDDSDPEVLPTTTFVETETSNCDWTTALLPTLNVAHSGDTMFVADQTGTQVMKKIVRVGATDFTVSDFDFEQNSAGYPKYQPYWKFADQSITLTPSGTSGSITLTASSAVFDTNNLHDGVIFRLIDDVANDTPKEVLVTSVSSSTVANATVRETLDGTTATTAWDEAAFSAKRGYQRTVQLGEQRLILGGSRDLPHVTWLSNTGAFFKFEEGTAADDQMVDRPIDSGKIEEIRGLLAGDNIEIFTDQGEHYMPLSETKPITPSSASLRKQTGHGINKKVPPLEYDGATIFVQRTGMMLREFVFDETKQKYESLPISLLATHLFQTTVNNAEIPADIQRSAVIDSTTRRPESYWFTVNNGTGEIIQFHSIRSEKIAGYSRWNTDGHFFDIAVVGNQMYTAVKREAAGDVWDSAFDDDFGRENTVYHLERMDPTFSLDFAKQIKSPAPTTTFSGLDHLAGREVHVVSRNAIYHGTFTVSSAGEVTIDESEVEIVAGLDYTTQLKTLRPRFTAAGYTVMGEIKRLINIVIDMGSTYSLKSNGKVLLIRRVSDDLSLDPTPTSEQKEFALRGYSRDGAVEILQDAPLPIRILNFQLTVGV